MSNIDWGHIILFSTTVLSLGFGFWQFMLKRRFEKKDKLVERRYEAYQNFMKLADEIGYKIRTDPNNLFSLINKYFSSIFSDDSTKSQEALNEFNSELFLYTQKGLEPFQIVNTELNKLRLICSKKLLPKVEEYKELIEYISHITTSNIGLLTKDPSKYYQIMMALQDSEQAKRMNSLWDEILELMRFEINNTT